MPPRDISQWLAEARAILEAECGRRDASVRIVISHGDTGRGISFTLPPADGEIRYAPTEDPPVHRVVVTPDTSLPVLGTVLAGCPGSTPPPTAPAIRLRSVHRRLLSAADAVPAKAERLCRKAGLSCNSTSRAALAELVRWDLLRHGPDGYHRPATAT